MASVTGNNDNEPGDELAEAVAPLPERFDPVPKSVVDAAKAAFVSRTDQPQRAGSREDELQPDRAEQRVVDAHRPAR